MKQECGYVLCYTREPQDGMIYSEKLAYSMHLAVQRNGEELIELNHNSGVLFAKATQNEDGTLNAKSLMMPYLFRLNEKTFGVIAIRTMADGGNDEQSKGKVLLFKSSDLLRYEEVGLLNLKTDEFITDVKCEYNEESLVYDIHWCDALGRYYQGNIKDILDLDSLSDVRPSEKFTINVIDTKIEGAKPRNMLPVNESIITRLIHKLTTPINIKITVPEEVNINTPEELICIKAEALYSDGTKSLKRVDWDYKNINFDISGTYLINGVVHQDHYEFPIAINRADPCIGKWKGKYYFIATNDADGNHSLYIREADSIPELVTAKEHLILDTSMYPQIGNLLWAPEFHIINDRMYIFHAASPGEFVKEHSHVMALKENGNMLLASDWEMPVPVVKKDGALLYEAGLTLDMTTFRIGEKQYVVWAQRQIVPVDQGSWLYIAEIDKNEPWKLITDPVLISMPEYGWANNHVFVDEGAYALITKDRLFLTFASALVDTTYVVGLLSADLDADLLNPDSFIKENYPLLTSRSVEGEYGPGHNSYVTDDDGIIWNAYHARPGIKAPRSSGLRRVHFDIDGYPVLDLTEEKDLSPELRNVSMQIIVGNSLDRFV